ncbi:hypothetical protein [Paenibacillus faecalis]|uniref:hypothetical protein n=1 Tax=Paenibacillus faecalis TaxID=2079532 RepID=UPI000D0F639C|nr:hypothetical protein [Paenibacillus faecalis]
MTLSRDHKQLRISNVFPMDLNFLLFIENIYKSYYGEKQVFPGRHLISNGEELLEAERFNEILVTCWEENVRELEQQQYMVKPFNPILFRDHYTNLFRKDSELHTSERVWNTFSLWWWSEYGIKTYMERYTDLFMPEIVEQIWKGLYDKNIEIDDGSSLYIILLFKQPDIVLQKNTNKLFFSSINNFVCKKEKIVNEIVDLFV